MGAEKKLEKRCCDIARANGWYTRKFSSPGNRGVPDRIFIKDGDVWFIEFKAPGNRPTPLQEHEMKKLEEAGAQVGWTDDATDFKLLLGIPT